MLGTLTFFLRDNNGRSSETRLWVIASGGAPDALVIANALRGPLLNLTSAVLRGAQYQVKLGGEEERFTPISADSRRSATLFYSNASEATGRMVIPSPVRSLVETTGPFAGFRITRQSAAAAGLLDELEAIVVGTVQSDNTPFPSQFDVGAIDESV